jgi:pimeloyl-ACP methyl ester carboxylesterase
LLLLHGLASTSRIFDLIAPMLAKSFRVVAYDQRGHGESSKPKSGYGFGPLAADVQAVIRATGLERPILLGHSWGANVSLEYAVRHPHSVAGTILLDGGIVPIRRWMDWQTARDALAPPSFAGIGLDEFRRRAVDHLPGVPHTPEVERVMRSLVRVGRNGTVRPRLSRRNHLRILRAMWEQDPLDLLRRVRVPLLALMVREAGTGAAGAMAGAKEAAAREARLAGVPLAWMDGIHDLPLQRPRALARRIQAFARSLTES